MAMTLRLSDEQTAALRASAEAAGESMQTLALRAIDEFLERTSLDALTDKSLDWALPRYAEVLRRLGE
jgi:hypothetical protein